MKRKIYSCFLVLSAFLVCAICGSNVVLAQGAGKTAGSPLGLFWDEIGPNNFGTMTRSMAIMNDGSVLAGSLGGGLWKSTNSGSTWTLNTGITDNLNVSSIAVDGNKIYVGTGELFFYDRNQISGTKDYEQICTFSNGNPFYIGSPGEGVYVSTDGGATFTHNNGTWVNGTSTPYCDDFASVQKVAASGGKVFVATLAGLYWSTDDLATVTKSNGGTQFTSNPILDVEFGDGNYVYACTKDSLYISSNGGTSFSTAPAMPDLGTPPHNRLGGARIEIAVSPSNPSTVYVTGANESNFNCNGVWKSTDNGATWNRAAPFETAGSTTFAPFSGSGRYAMTLAVDPNDPNAWIVAGERLYTFDNVNGLVLGAATTFIPGFTTNYLPTPIHCIVYDPNNSDRVFYGTEHEIMASFDGGMTTSFRTKGYNCGHNISVNASPNYKVVSTERATGVGYRMNANPNPSQLQFNEIYDDAIGVARFSMTNFDFIVTQGSDGGLERSLSNGATWEPFYGPPLANRNAWIDGDSVYVDRADSTSEGGGLYDVGGSPVTPWCFDEVIPAASLVNDSLIQNTPAYIYMCSKHFVWVCHGPFASIDSVPRWTRITNSLIKNTTIPAEQMTAIAVSGDNDHVVYAGTNHGNIVRINNANDPSVIDSAHILRIQPVAAGLPQRWITDIAFDPSDPNNLVITYGAYENTGSSMVYITNNAKSASPTFRSIGETMPDIVPVYSAAFHPDPGIGALLIGTEIGVYSTTDDWTSASPMTWNEENMGMHRVPVYDIYIRPYYQNVKPTGYSYGPDNVVFIATYGRGVYKSTTVVSRDKEGDDRAAMMQYDAKLYPNPTSNFSTVELEIPVASSVRIEAYDLEGRRVAVLADGEYPAGTVTAEFNTANLHSGIYFVKSFISNEQGEMINTQKAVVVK